MKTKQHAGQFPLQAAAVGLLALTAILPAQADYPSTVASLNPVGYWRLNEPVSPTLNYALGTVTNFGSLGAVANGTYYHSSTLQEPGVLTTDPCVKLDGASQYIDVPYSPALNTNGPFSVEFWANQTVIAAGAKSGVMSFDGSTGFLFYTDNNDFHWGFRVFFGSGRTYVKDTGPDNQPNTWYHVVGVFDGTLVHIYVNGVENTAPQAIGGNGYVPNTTAPLRIGAGNPAGAASLFFPGWMDEVAVYPYALSSSQIAAHHDAATANPAGYAALITGDKPTGYWRFNERPCRPNRSQSSLRSPTAAVGGLWQMALSIRVACRAVWPGCHTMDSRRTIAPANSPAPAAATSKSRPRASIRTPGRSPAGPSGTASPSIGICSFRIPTTWGSRSPEHRTR